jgi:hypothetical protein
LRVASKAAPEFVKSVMCNQASGVLKRDTSSYTVYHTSSYTQPGFCGTEKRLVFQKQAQKKRHATLVLAYMVIHFGRGGGERGGGERGVVVYYCST